MITNLIASIVICLVTNSTDHFPQHMITDPSPVGPNGEIYCVYYGHPENDSNPKEKVVVTEIKEVTTITFEWCGQEKKVISERVIESKSQGYVLDQQWKPATVNLPQPPFYQSFNQIKP